MRAPVDMTGIRYGRLVAISPAGPSGGRGGVPWIFRCDCGTTKTINGYRVRVGESTSCGCFRRDAGALRGASSRTHGKSGSPTYMTWQSMLERCENKRHDAYADYGGRGIKVCERWHLFADFYEDMGERPSGLTLDRYPDKNGNYEPSNCRWATWNEQARNRRGNVRIEFDGHSATLAEWSERTGLARHVLAYRIASAWPLDRAFTEPVRPWPGKRNRLSFLDME